MGEDGVNISTQVCVIQDSEKKESVCITNTKFIRSFLFVWTQLFLGCVFLVNETKRGLDHCYRKVCVSRGGYTVERIVYTRDGVWVGIIVFCTGTVCVSSPNGLD